MQTHFELSDKEFEVQFQNCELNPTLFSHEAHLRLAWIHINQYGLKQALKNIESQLKSFVAHVGAKDKYHQTVTIVAIEAVNHFMNKSKSNDFKIFIENYPQLMTSFKELVNSHYTFDVFSSQKARKEYIQPDLCPFS